MLKTKNLSFAYNANRKFDFPDMTCQNGEKWLILGQSGCGKTTLLHLLGGMLHPSAGEIEIGETAIEKLPPPVLDAFRGKNVGIVFQKSHFIAALNVEENLLLAQQLAGVPRDRALIKALLTQLNLGHQLRARPSQLSIGEQQRVAIARALVNNPQVILADEPTSALDDQNTDEVIKLLEEQASRAHATLIIVTHDARLKAYFKNQIQL